MRHAVFSALAIPRFAAYAAGQTVSHVGLWTQQVAVSWLAWDLTHSEQWLGIVAFCQFAPALLVAPIAGALADRFDRLLLAIVTLGLAAGQAMLLWALSVSGLLTIEALIGCVLLQGLVTSLSFPTMRVVLRSLVPEALLPAAVSLNSVTINVARFTGPALAGAFIYWDVLEFSFLFNALSYLAIILPLLSFRLGEVLDETPRPGARPSLAADVKEGAVHAWRDPYARLMLSAYLAYALLGRPAIDLLPAIVDRTLNGDAGALALLNSVFGIAAVVAGLAMAGILARDRLEGVMRASLALVAAGTLWLAFSPSLGWALPAMAVYGIGQVAANIATQTLLHLASEDRLRGRMMSLHFLMFRGGAAIGGLGVGMLAERIGLGGALGLCAGGLFAVFALTLVWRPKPR